MTSSQFESGIYALGLGVKEIAQMTLESYTALKEMDCVIYLTENKTVGETLQKLGIEKSTDLSSWYKDGEDRAAIYERISSFVVDQSKSHDRVCLLTPGNPIFLNRVILNLIDRCEAQGIALHVFPGVSSIDTIMTDLRLPSGEVGVQCFEATKFFHDRPNIDTRVPLLLFQPGNFAHSKVQMRMRPTQEQIAPLTGYLLELYPPDSRWILVGSSGDLGEPPRIMWNYLSELEQFSELLTIGTLVLPGSWWPNWLGEVPHSVEST